MKRLRGDVIALIVEAGLCGITRATEPSDDRWRFEIGSYLWATSINGQLLQLSDRRNPYPGKLGVVEVGAFADLLVVDGDPLTNLALIEEPEKNFVVIMKDGVVYKHTID